MEANLTEAQKNILDVAVKIYNDAAGKISYEEAIEQSINANIFHCQRMIQTIENIKNDKPENFYGENKYRAQYQKMQDGVKSVLENI